ncbi:TlpA family protein disulfide reductase [Flavobacterium chungangensis]|uniref:TlpA family protein disulfide reductase n=1 Tax=Flavobacterium chungangensis TaxID=2708132 RepID=A0ABV8Z839_9FLAO
MKKLFVAGLVIFNTLNIVAQDTNSIKFTATIANRNSDTLIIKGRDNFEKIIPIDKKGVFATAFDAPQGFYVLYDGKESSNLYLKPNSEVNLTLNAQEFDETIVYKGKGVEESNFLAQQALKDENFTKEAFTKEPNEFAALLDGKLKSDTEKIEKSDFPAEFKTALKRSFESFHQYVAQDYERVLKSNKFIGKASPSFDYENYKGGKTKLSDFKGKYVYIDLWAIWCAPCRAEIPYLKKLEEKYHGKNIEFVSISIDKLKDSEKWRKFVADKSLGGTQLLADKDWESEFIVNYNVTGIPRFILLDPSGNIVKYDAARPSDPELDKQLTALLN